MAFIESLLSRVVGSIMSSVFKKMAYKFPNLNGSWVYEQLTTQSAYNPYIGMKLRYIVLLSINPESVNSSAIAVPPH
jgi:hypothetical protein